MIPGGLDVGREPLPDLHRVMADLRAEAPVARVLFHGDPALLLLGYDLVDAALRDETTYPAAHAYRRFAEPVQGRTLQCLDTDEHRVHRALVAAPFLRSSVERLTGELIEPLARRLVDELDPSGDVELIGSYCRRLPFLVMARLLGIPEAADVDLRRWADGLLNYLVRPTEALAAAAAFTDFVTPLLAERRAAPGDDLLSHLCTVEVDGRSLTDDEILPFVRLLFPAGADTTYLALGSLLGALLTRPELRDAARTDPALRRQSVEEGLRWEPAVAIQPRVSGRSASPGGQDVEPGDWVLFGIAAANRDPAVYDDPDRFDPMRWDPSRRPRTHLAFGAGPHHCLGLHLARAELDLGVAALLDRFPNARVADPGVVEVRGPVFRGPRKLHVRLDG